MSDRTTEERWTTAQMATLGVVVVVGLAIRLAFVAIRQSKVVLTTGDAYWYHYQSKLVANGHGFLNPFLFYKDGLSVPGADHPPGFVLLLTAATKLGIDSPQGQRYLMCLFGTATIVVVGLLGRRVAGNRVGVIAAALAAIYPNFWINDGMLMTETIYILAISSALYFAYGVLRGAGRLDLLGLAFALTTAAMVRQEALLFFVILVLPLVLLRREQPWKERLLRVGFAALIPIVAFAPWAIYNQGRFAEPTPISTGAGQTLAAGNCDLTYSGEHLGWYDIRCLRPPQIDPPTDPDPSVRDIEYRNLARSYIRDNLGDVPKVVAARVGRMWHLYQVGQGVQLDGYIEGRSGGPPGSSLEVVWAAVWSFYVLVLLAIGGVVVLRRRRIALYPLLVIAAQATFTAAISFGVTRYRAGAEVVIVVLAAVALSALWGRVAARRGQEPAVTEAVPAPTV